LKIHYAYCGISSKVNKLTLIDEQNEDITFDWFMFY